MEGSSDLLDAGGTRDPSANHRGVMTTPTDDPPTYYVPGHKRTSHNGTPSARMIGYGGRLADGGTPLFPIFHFLFFPLPDGPVAPTVDSQRKRMRNDIEKENEKEKERERRR